MNVEYKSIGTLFDEMFTADLKLEHWPNDEEISERRHALGNCITVRLLDFFQNVIKDHQEIFRINNEIWKVANELKSALREYWNAQETIMRYTGYSTRELESMIGHDNLVLLEEAAITAQTTNATRNQLIREIDRILQESQLRKTHDRAS